MDTSSQRLAESPRKRLVDTIGVGVALWAIGYAIGMALYAFIPTSMIGWIVLPIMVPVTAYVSIRRLKTVAKSISYILIVAATWTSIAVAFDYVFLVDAFNVQNYYDFDVLIYYALTFLIPVIVGIVANPRFRKIA